MKAITDFSGQYSFLSMKFPCTVMINGRKFKTAQSALKEYRYSDKNGTYTKQAREDWISQRDAVMTAVVEAKFSQNPELKIALLNTGDAELIYENNNGDSYWGTVHGEGKNRLGQILMNVRSILSVPVDYNSASSVDISLIAKLKVKSGLIQIYDLDFIVDYPLSMYKVACAYINMNPDDFLPSTDNVVKTFKYKKHLLDQHGFREILEDIQQQYDRDDENDQYFMRIYAKDALECYLRDLGGQAIVDILRYIGI